MAKAPLYDPRLIIHGGAGNITRDNLPLELWQRHQKSLLAILDSTNKGLQGGTDALSAAVHAVKLFEANPLYNCGRGAVFTRAGTIELEASVMVSSGRRKRGAAVSLIKHVKHPIELAANILRRGDEDEAGGAQGHVHISGTTAEELASQWGQDICEESYFWTRHRWQEHRRGLDRSWRNTSGFSEESLRPDGSQWSAGEAGWDAKDFLTQGTVGVVAMDKYGTLAVATSTGGLTNKLPGRIGDTPTFGAGFWAEEWVSPRRLEESLGAPNPPSLISNFTDPMRLVQDCLPFCSDAASRTEYHADASEKSSTTRAVAMSGTGNGDSFLRLSAVRTAGALARFFNATSCSLANAVTWMAGQGGQLQLSAGDRWGRTGEGAGGIIGIERDGERSTIVADFNCGGMFRAWLDDKGRRHCMVFHDDF